MTNLTGKVNKMDMSENSELQTTETLPKQKHKKRKLYDWHIWLGFNLAFLTMLLLATGTISTISNEIDWLIQDDMRVTPGTEKVSWGEMEAKVKAAADPNHMLTILSESEGDHFAYRATFLRVDGTRYHIHINQWTGEITGTTPFLTVQRFFRDLHRYFFMPSFIGLPIVSALAIVLMISLYTGLKTAGKLKKAAFRIRRGQGTRVFLSDLHKVAGIWSTWFIALMTLSGIWYLIEFGSLASGKGFEPERPGPSIERIQAFNGSINMLPADEVIAKAKEAFPDWTPVQILYPRSHKQAITVLGYTGDILVRSRANRVFLDPEDGSIIKVQKSTDIGTVAYINEIADPLHFGNFGKLTTKLIWFFFGICLTGMSVTGVIMTYRRLKKTHISRAQVKTLPILVLTAVFGYFYIERQTATLEESKLVAQSAFTHDGYQINTQLKRGIKSHQYYLQVDIENGGGFPVVESVKLSNANDKSYTLRPTIFSTTFIASRILPKADDAVYASMALDIEFSPGDKKQFALKM